MHRVLAGVPGPRIRAVLLALFIGTSASSNLRPFLLSNGTAPEHSAKYWDLKFSSKRISETRAREELRYLLKNAVARRLVADVPVGAFLSGGIDSSVIVALMSELCEKRVNTFCVGFDAGADWDERRYARLVADRYETEHRELVVGSQSIDLVEDLVRYHDQPFVDSSAVPTYLVSKFAREHVTVALTGDGGDELFAGYQRFRAVLLAEQIPDFCFGLAKKCAPLVKRLSAKQGRRLVRLLAGGVECNQACVSGPFSHCFRLACGSSAVTQSPRRLRFFEAGRSSMTTRQLRLYWDGCCTAISRTIW